MARRPRPVPRRGRFFDYPKTTLSPAQRVLRNSGRIRPAVRRGEFWAGPWQIVVVTAPSYVPPMLTRRRPRTPVRRGEFYPAPWPPVTPSVPALPPLVLARRRPLRGPRRPGEFFALPWPQITPTAPTFPPPTVARRRPARGPRRVGEFFPVVPVVGPPPTPLDTRRPPVRALRRGRFLWTPLVEVIPAGPGPWAPEFRTGGFRPAPKRARGMFLVVIGEGAACTCNTLRPSSGVTSRPGSATTTRPNAGVTLRPCTCT